MVLSYDHSNQKRWRRQTNAPPVRAVLMAMVVCRCDMERITRCRMTRASPEATGHHHRATTPYRPGGHQGDKQLNDYETCTHFVGHFIGHRDATVLYRAQNPMEEVQGFHKSH